VFDFACASLEPDLIIIVRPRVRPNFVFAINLTDGRFIRSGCGTFLIEMPIFRGGPVTVDAVPLFFGLFEMRRNPK
jgi:hypothetical protein